MTAESTFDNNKFEILMKQLETTCSPGFLERKEEDEQKNQANMKMVEEGEEKNQIERQSDSISGPICFERPAVGLKPCDEQFQFAEEAAPREQQRRPASVPSPRASSGIYRPPISPRAPIFERRRSSNNNNNYQPPSSPSYQQNDYYRYPSKTPISPRTQSFERTRSFNQGSISPRAPSFERMHSFNQPRHHSRRLYVFNIPADVNEEEFRDYFSQYGTLTSCGFENDVIEEDANTTTKRGFVAYDKSESTVYVLENSNALKLHNENIRVKRATSQKTQLFVGGYDLYTQKSELIGFFSRYGEVCDFVMKYDAEGVSRCFGFLTFRDSEDAVKNLVKERFVECLGKTVEIKRAAKTKRSYVSYSGTPMTNSTRVPVSPRFSRESLEFGNAPPLSPRPSFDRNRSNASTSSIDSDHQIEGTKMYSRKFFAPARPGMKTNPSKDE